MAKRKTRSRLFYQYFVTYAAVFLLTFASLAVFFNKYVMNELLKISERDYTNLLASRVKSVEQVVGALDNVALQIENLPDMSYYMTSNNPATKARTIQNLRVIMSTNPAIQFIAIRFEQEPDYFITTAGTISVGLLCGNYITGSWDGGDLLSELANGEGGRLVLTGSTSDLQERPERLLYISSFPGNMRSGYGKIIFVLDPSIITGLFADTSQVQDYFIVFTDMTRNQRLIVNSISELSPALESGELPHGAASQYMILESTLSGGSSYTVGVHKDQLWRPVNRVWQVCLTLLSTISVLGVLFSFVFSEHIYSPIRSLSLMMGLGGRERENELKLMSGSVSDLVEVKNQLASNMSRIKSQLFENLMYSKQVDRRETEELLSFLKLELEHPYFRVLRISPMRQGEDSALRTIHDYLEKKDFLYCNKDYHSVLILVNLPCEGDDYAVKYFDGFAAVIEEQTNIVPMISIGRSTTDLFQLHQSFLDAAYVHNCNSFGPKAKVFTLSGLRLVIDDNYHFPKREEENLINALQSGNEEKAWSWSRAIVEKVNKDRVEADIIRGIYISVLNNVKAFLESEGYVISGWAFNIRHFVFTTNNDLTGIDDKFLECMKQLIHAAGESTKSNDNVLINMICGYIDDNYHRYDISLNVVAKMICLSPSYATRIFKAATGYSIKEYIDQRRLKEAKRLLMETGLPLSAVSEQTGLVDTSAFCRKFKKLEGVSPGEYRRTHANAILADKGDGSAAVQR